MRARTRATVRAPRVPPSVHRKCKAQGRMPLQVQGRMPLRVQGRMPLRVQGHMPLRVQGRVPLQVQCCVFYYSFLYFLIKKILFTFKYIVF